ncbi:MAG: hypothetical protein IPG31_09350 [Nitrosomonas sp.]|nr:hypothetical protein [Nitrosomonas sp.]
MKSNKPNSMGTFRLSAQGLAAMLLLSVSPFVLAHPGLRYDPAVSQTAEYSIEHGCGSNPVIGSIIVLPDVGFSPLVKVNGEATEESLADLVASANATLTVVIDKSVFDLQVPIRDELGNAVGFWSGGGTAVPSTAVASLPFRPNVTAEFLEESCVSKVTYRVTAIDVCNQTTLAEGVPDQDWSFWVPAVGSDFDGEEGGHAYDWTRNITVTRDLEEMPLPTDCGEGDEILVSPSPEQLNRDLRIKLDGQQIWPLP